MMKRKFAGIFAVLLALTCTPAIAERVHVTREISERIAIDADIELPEASNCALYTLVYPDLNASDALNESMSADRFFRDLQSPRTTRVERDEQYREGGGQVLSDAGEWVSAGQDGMLYYRDQLVYDRYGGFQLELIKSVAVGQADLITLGNVNGELDNLSRNEAEQMTRAALAPYCFDFEPILAMTIFVDAGTLMRSAKVFQNEPFEYTAEDEIYLLYYQFSHNGLPVVSRYAKDWTKLTATDGKRRFSEGPYAFFGIDRDGIFFADIQTATLDSGSKTAQPLSYTQALDRLSEYLGELMPPMDMVITAGYLKYAALRTGKDYFTFVLEPIWFFPCKAQRESGEWYVERVFAVHGITGSMLL